jgi:hypothetical protein
MLHTTQITRRHTQEDELFIVTAMRTSFTKHFLETNVLIPRPISCDCVSSVDSNLRSQQHGVEYRRHHFSDIPVQK